MFALTVGLVFSPSISPPCVTGRSFYMKSALLLLLSSMFFVVFFSYFDSQLSQTTFSIQSFFHAHMLKQTQRVYVSSPRVESTTKLITVPLNRGRTLTLSHGAPGIINSLRIVRGISVTIFTRHNYCQSGDRNQEMNRDREGGLVLPSVSGQHLRPSSPIGMFYREQFHHVQ